MRSMQQKKKDRDDWQLEWANMNSAAKSDHIAKSNALWRRFVDQYRSKMTNGGFAVEDVRSILNITMRDNLTPFQMKALELLIGPNGWAMFKIMEAQWDDL